MIDAAQFEHQFNKLCAAFGVSKSEKIKDAWFEEFEECDYFTFCEAIKLLQRGTGKFGSTIPVFRPSLSNNLALPHTTSPLQHSTRRGLRVRFPDKLKWLFSKVATRKPKLQEFGLLKRGPILFDWVSPCDTGIHNMKRISDWRQSKVSGKGRCRID